MNKIKENQWDDDPVKEVAGTGIMTDDGLRQTGANVRNNQWDKSTVIENIPQFYVVRVNGAVVSAKYATALQAEQHVAALPQETQFIAEVIQVDQNGAELLLG